MKVNVLYTVVVRTELFLQLVKYNTTTFVVVDACCFMGSVIVAVLWVALIKEVQ